MKRAIIIHRQDFAAIIALVIGAIVVTGYILLHQPAFTLFKSYYTVKAEFSTAAAVTAGQGQSVDIAGVTVGQVGGVSYEDGHAVVTMNIYKKYAPIYYNATVLLRPRTPLQDMYLALDPGSKSAGAVPENGTLGVASTQPDIDTDQILDSLDGDTRDYLLLLLSGGAQLFENGNNQGPHPSQAAVNSLRDTFKRFAPLNRDTETLTSLLATRSTDISHAINGLQQVSRALGGVNGQLTSLINSSNTNFQAISSQDEQLESGLSLLPGTLSQTTTTLGKVRGFAAASTTALHGLIPFAHAFGPALQAARPLFEDTTSVIKNELRPFAVAVQPVARILAPAAAKLAVATPKLADSIRVLNALFNTLAYQRKGGPPSYLFWGSWLSHITASLTDTQDAQGPILRGLYEATCPELNLLDVTIEPGSPSLGPLLDLLNVPDWSKIDSKYCPAAGGL